MTSHLRQIGLTNDLDDPHQIITVRRRHIWSDTKRIFSKPYANLTQPVKVVFVGEQAEDEGGPKREFFRLALAAATSDPALFSGPCERRAVQHNTTALLQKEFRHVGNLISMSLVQGGPGPMCFVPWIYDYLSLGVDGLNCTQGSGEVSLEEVLSFFSGASKIPPLGFDIAPSLSFNHKAIYPTASMHMRITTDASD